jgi:hypothetical protein
MAPPKDYNARYCTDKQWYRRTPDREWINVTEGKLNQHLILQGVDPDPKNKAKFSELEQVTEDIMDHYRIDFVGDYAVENENALILKGARLIEPVEGDFEFYWSFIESTFPKKDQADAVHSWNYWNQMALRDDPGKWRHGQALIMVGDPGLGKTSYQHIITYGMTGRATDPALFMKGETTFNEQMGRCEHYLLSDPGRSSKHSEHFLSEVKKAVANIVTSVHPKGKQLISIPLLKRISVTLNKDSESLSILQGMIKSDLDKIVIVNFENAGKFAPNAPDGLDFWQWDRIMRKQQPAYNWWLLNGGHKIPVHMRDPMNRYGFFYRNVEIEGEVTALTPEDREEALMDVVFHGLFTNAQYSVNGDSTLVGLKAGQIFDRLMEVRPGGVKDRAKAYDDLKNEDRVGRLLTRWLHKYKGICVDFSFIAYKQPCRGNSHFYDFVRNPTEEDYATKMAKLQEILRRAQAAARKRSTTDWEAV